MIDVLTINAGGTSDRFGSVEARADKLARITRDAAPAICALQAVAPGLIDRLKPQLAEWPHVHVGDAGLALLSSEPIEAARSLALERLPSPEDDNRRALLIATVGGLQIAVAHFSWVEELAERNVGQTLEAIGTGDALIVGDMNQEPASRAIAMLGQAGFVDCWARLRHGEPGYSFPADSPTARIDYAWARGVSVERIDLVGSGDPVADHLGLSMALAA